MRHLFLGFAIAALSVHGRARAGQAREALGRKPTPEAMAEYHKQAEGMHRRACQA